MNNNINDFENLVSKMLEHLDPNPQREGLEDTPNRVANSLKYLTSGYSEDPKQILQKAVFKTNNTQMVLVKDIEFYSLCEHHLLPFFGNVAIAYIPNGEVVGLSKLPRLVEVFSKRLQIQEELCEQIASALWDNIHPKGVAVHIKAKHMCMQMRGVKVNADTITTAFKGEFLKDNNLKQEFLNQIR